MAIITAASLQVIQVSGGNLFQIAAQYLGDATQWDRIAQLNNVKNALGQYDPMITAPITLQIPPMAPPDTGVIGV